MYAAVVTAGLFTGILINDLIVGQPQNEILKHFLYGFVSTSLMITLIIKGASMVAWGLLVVPLMVISGAFFMTLLRPVEKVVPVQTTIPLSKLPAIKPQTPSMLNLPDTPYIKTVCEEITPEPPKRNNMAPMCDVGPDGSYIIPLPEDITPNPPSPGGGGGGGGSGGGGGGGSGGTDTACATKPITTPAEAPKAPVSVLGTVLTSVTKNLTPSTICPSV